MPIRPLVLAPQIANPPIKAQKVRLFEATLKVWMVRRAAPGWGVGAGSTAAFSSVP